MMLNRANTALADRFRTAEIETADRPAALSSISR
jgi:hypothetical protein